MDSKNIPERPDYKEFVKSYSVYPPIFRDESLEKLESRSQLAAKVGGVCF